VSSLCNGADQKYYKFNKKLTAKTALEITLSQSVCSYIFETYEYLEHVFDSLNDFTLILSILSDLDIIPTTGARLKEVYGDSLLKYSIWRESFTFCGGILRFFQKIPAKYATCKHLCAKFTHSTEWKDHFNIFKTIDYTYDILTRINQFMIRDYTFGPDEDFYLSVHVQDRYSQDFEFSFMTLKEGHSADIVLYHSLEQTAEDSTAEQFGVRLHQQPLVLKKWGGVVHYGTAFGLFLVLFR
jgi:hypothetical protein